MTKTKTILKILFCGIGLLLASCNTIDDSELMVEKKTLEQPPGNGAGNEFRVSRALLNKFIAVKKEKPNAITPIVIEGDTLAYRLDYTKGWKLISGDQRLSPVVSESDHSSFNLSDPNNPEALSIQGLLNYIKELRNSDKTEKNAIWEFLSKERKTSNKARKVQARGLGRGMWIATDTTYEESTRTYPHVITTAWHQNFPYNMYCPLSQNSNGSWVNSQVGCCAVAVGQVIYHYRKDNNRNIAIPTDVTGPDMNNKDRFIVNSSSVDGWNNLDIEFFVAMFLRDVGIRLHTTYSANGSSAPTDYMYVLRQDYLLDYNSKASYDYQTLITYLKSRQPVITVALSPSATSGHAVHMFIIDGYKEEVGTFVIRYEWDENHIITDEEWMSAPQGAFEPDPKGDTERFEELEIEKDTYITMNWGWDSSYNSTWYLAHEYAPGYQSSDFAGSFNVPSKDIVHAPYWTTVTGTYNSVSNMFYNFREYYP
ncbi:MAG: C10 family peptidase [bacterium]|nr:C10 family peptidase [bacterium]